jgi:uncharacterized protein YqgC (DUF456 family)
VIIAWTILSALLMVIASVVGVVLTLFTFSGVWVTLLVAILLQLGYAHFLPEVGPLFSWWTIGAGAIIGFAAELIELFASAAGAKRSGGGRSGAVGSVIGGVLGALGGSFLIPIPIVGTIAGAVIGAGLGATVGERGVAGRSWQASMKVGAGAAKGRFIATIAKTILAALVGLVLCVAVLWP